MNSKELDKVLKVLKKHGVEEYKNGEIQIKVSPIALMPKVKNSNPDSVSLEDLYYSADKVKINNKTKQ